VRCRRFRDRLGEATEVSQGTRPQGLNPGSSKYEAGVLLSSFGYGLCDFLSCAGPCSQTMSISCEFTAFRVRHASLYILNVSSSISPRRLTGLVRQVQLLFRDGSVVGNIVWSR